MLDTLGRWHEILPGFGIDSRSLSGKHTACPLCGGKDRFRFDNKEGKGTWICNQCGAGSGFTLIMKLRQVDFKEALKLINPLVAGDRKIPARPNDESRKRNLREAWKSSRPVTTGDRTDRYLSARGITLRSPALRTIDRCRTARGEYYPAMLAVLSDVDGKAVTLHRTYLAEGKKAAIASPREMMSATIPPGAAIRLSNASETLGIAEGIETALSASQLFGIPVWSAICATMMEKWQPPTETVNIVIFGDNDINHTGQKCAYCLANKLALKGKSVSVKIPEIAGDWNDVLMKKEETA